MVSDMALAEGEAIRRARSGSLLRDSLRAFTSAAESDPSVFKPPRSVGKGRSTRCGLRARVDLFMNMSGRRSGRIAHVPPGRSVPRRLKGRFAVFFHVCSGLGTTPSNDP
jgi:hypothetical protein